jgi:zinc protease
MSRKADMTMEQIEKITLENGLSVSTRRNPATPTVSFALRIATGDIDDPGNAIGLSDFAAAVIIKGTEKRSQRELAEKIDSLGMELHFGSGRHTSMLVGRTMNENLGPALKLCREILESATPPEEEIQRMKQRMQTALKMQLDDPATAATDRLREMIYGPEHPYGRPIRQRIEGLGRIDRTMVIEYYRNALKPGAIRGVVVGDVETDQVETSLKTAFGSWKTGGSFDITRFEPVQDPEKPRREDILLPGKTQSDISLGWQGIERTHEDYYALLVGNTALGRMGLGGRIGQRVREAEGMAYYAYTTFSAGVGAGPFMMRAGVDPANIDRAIEITLEELETARKEGLSAEEISDAAKYLSGSMARQMETNGGLASVLLNQEMYGLGDDYYRRFPEILARLTANDVGEAFQRQLKPDSYCCAVAGPEG